MSIVNQDELKAIKVLKVTSKASEWDHWSEKFVALARARGLQGYSWVQRRHPEQMKRLIERKKTFSYVLTEAEKEKKRLRQTNGSAYINLQL